MDCPAGCVSQDSCDINTQITVLIFTSVIFVLFVGKCILTSTSSIENEETRILTPEETPPPYS